MGVAGARDIGDWREGFAEVEPGVRLHYVEQGEGPLVLLLHGFPEHWYSWRHQIPALAGAGFRAVAPDLRGYNLSDKPAGLRPYRMERLVDDVRALVRHFGVERASIAGHDWGGAIAWSTAIAHPAVVDRLAVFNCPHPAAWARNMRRDGRYNLKQVGRSWYMLAFQVPFLPERLLARRAEQVVGRGILGTAVHPEAFTAEDVARYRDALRVPGAARGAIAYYRAALRSSLARAVLTATPPPVPPITAPTLVVWGERDTALGRELTDGMEAWFAGPFALRFIPDASHWVQQDRPDLCSRWLVEHLRA